MNSLKMSVFALGMSLSMRIMAASTLDSTTGSEDNLNRPSPSGSPTMQDCSVRNGNDKLLCEQQLQNDSAKSLPNDNSRINRNNDGNMIDDRKSKDLQSRDRELNNLLPNDLQHFDSQPGVTDPRNPNPSSPDSTGTGTGTGTGTVR